MADAALRKRTPDGSGEPRTAAGGDGRLSFSQVRALTRVATPETEAELLELAEGCPTAVLERKVRAWRKGSRRDEAARERQRHRSRRLSVVPDDDGMYAIRGRLTPEVGAALRRAIEAAEDALYRREQDADDDAAPGSAEPGCSAEHPSPRRARREACVAATVQVNRGGDGSVLDMGRRTRTVPPALRRALEVRDRGRQPPELPDEVWFPAVEAGMAAGRRTPPRPARSGAGVFPSASECAKHPRVS